MKVLYMLILGILFLNLASAVPQIFNTNFNLTLWSNQSGNITNGIYSVIGEGGQLQNSFAVVGSCNFSYNLNNIPLIFSRDINQNETDVAILIRALAINNNISKEWQECNKNLSWCILDTGYKQNYTECNTQLQIQKDNANYCANQIITKDNEITVQTQQKWFAVGGCVIFLILTINFWRRSRVKTTKNPISDLPSGRSLSMIKQERTDITSELRFPLIMFGDGYLAQVLEIIPSKNQDSLDVWKMRLIPTNELAKKHRIGLEMLDENRSLIREFPIEMVKPWSLDPTWTLYVCYLNIWGEETTATQYIKGKLDADVIINLKKELGLQKAANAYLVEQNYKAKTNVRQYVQDDVMGIADLMNISIANSPQIAQQPQLTGVVRTGTES